MLYFSCLISSKGGRDPIFSGDAFLMEYQTLISMNTLCVMEIPLLLQKEGRASPADTHHVRCFCVVKKIAKKFHEILTYLFSFIYQSWVH